MATKQELEVSIKSLKKVAENPATKPAVKKTLLASIKKAESQLEQLKQAEKIAKSPKITPKQEDKVDDVKQDSKKMLSDLKKKIADAKSKIKTKVLTNDQRKEISKEIRKKQSKIYKGVRALDSDIEKDAGRPALPPGRRVSKKTGNVYYENRENRIDRRPQKYAKLEEGGIIAYANNDMDNRVAVFKDLQEAKKFAKANKHKYENIQFEDEKGDSIYVSKEDTFKDIDWLFSQTYEDGGMMANGGGTQANNRGLLKYVQTDEQLDVLESIIPILNKKGIQLRYGTSIGKSPQTIIFDKDYQDGILRISDGGYDDEYLPEFNDKEFTDAEDFKAILKSMGYEKGGVMAKGGNTGSYKEHKIGDYVEVYQVMGNKTELKKIVGFEDNDTYILKDKDGNRSFTPKKYIANASGEFPMMKRGGKTDYKYVPNQNIAEVVVERNGKETIIDGSKILDGIYVKGGVRFMDGGDVDANANQYLVYYKSENPAYADDKGFGNNPPDVYYADTMFEVLEYLRENMPSDVEILGVEECEMMSYGHGGSLEQQNKEMLMSNIKEIKHHAEELEKVAKKTEKVDAWVIAKSERASTDLSDITHYLEGRMDSIKDMMEDDDDDDVEDDEMKSQEGYMEEGGMMRKSQEATFSNRYILMKLDKKSGFGMILNIEPLDKISALSMKEKLENKKNISNYEIKVFTVEEILKRKSLSDETKEAILLKIKEEADARLRKYTDGGEMAKGGGVGSTDKNYNIKYGVGKSKYVVSFHDGQKTHKDGSPFYDIEIFKSKTEMNKFITKLNSDGYREKMGMGGKTSFKDKVSAISKRLEGTKVPKRLQKDYGKKYNKKESIEAGKRIAGSMKAKYVV